MAPSSRRKYSANARFHHLIQGIICTSLLAWLTLGLCRGIILDQPTGWMDLARSVPDGIAASYYDLLFILAVTLVTIALLVLTRPRRIVRMILLALYYVVMLVALAWGIANVNLVGTLGEPFTFQWLVYGDFLQNADARSALSDALNLRDLSLLAGGIAAVLLVAHVLARGWRRLGPLGHRVLLGAVVFAVAVATVGSRYHVTAAGLPDSKLQNPVVYFLQSALLNPTPAVLTMPANKNDPDVASVGERPADVSTFRAPEPNPIRNVLIVMLESVPSKYIENYGGAYPVTPNIKSYAGSAIRFDTIYAHAPSTNYTLFSLLSSLYNDISYYGMTGSHPDLKLDSLPNMMAKNGFRTGFFWGADSRFQRVDEFLMNKGFDVVQDYRGQHCELPTYKLSTSEWKNADYNSDLCTADATLGWISQEPAKPFFAIMFTAMTHYPYQVADPADPTVLAGSGGAVKLVHYSDDEKFNSYLNALRIGDEAFGRLLDGLKQSGQLDSTLVVVLGDHGEAFGEHGTYSHGSALYEENVHIPLLFINSHLFQGQANDRVGGLIDIGPTIFDILGLKMPGQWQGHSLFSANRPDRTFFFAPWRGVQFGYRIGDRKVIFNANAGRTEVYDLKADPGEKKNLFGDSITDETAVLQPIADWVQSQRPRIARLVADHTKDAPACGITSISVDAGGTDYLGPPHMQVLMGGNLVGEFDVPGQPSHAKTSAEASAELRAAAAYTKPFDIKLPGTATPSSIEIRFTNDQWGTPDRPGDRNLFIKTVKVNGVQMPDSHLYPDEVTDGATDDTGTSLYGSGSLWVTGPFDQACN